MDMLRARLYEQELRRREEKASEIEAGKTEIGWGHQIRSYVLQPYQLIKDLRTGEETSDTQAVLDGDIDRFLESDTRKYRQKIKYIPQLQTVIKVLLINFLNQRLIKL